VSNSPKHVFFIIISQDNVHAHLLISSTEFGWHGTLYLAYGWPSNVSCLVGNAVPMLFLVKQIFRLFGGSRGFPTAFEFLHAIAFCACAKQSRANKTLALFPLVSQCKQSCSTSLTTYNQVLHHLHSWLLDWTGSS